MIKALSNLSTRGANLLGALVCVALLGYAYFSQYVMHLDPCPLCIFQRIGVFAVCVVFLVAAAHDPRGSGRKAYAALLFVAAAATIGVAAKHLWIQAQPPGTVAECGASLKFMLKVLPLTEVFSRVLNGSGECAKITWRFLGLSMPAWVLIAASGLGGYGLWANLRRRPQALRA